MGRPGGKQQLPRADGQQHAPQPQRKEAAFFGGIEEDQLRQDQLEKKFHRLPPIKSDIAARKLLRCGREISSCRSPTVTLFLLTALT